MELSRRTFSAVAGTAALGLALGGSGGATDARAVLAVPTGPAPAPPGADGRQDVHLEPASPAIQSDHLVRLLEAGLWCETEDADPVTGQVLAEDRNALVRQYMAMRADKAHLQVFLREDVRRSVRSRLHQG
ncbi:hypothetical protein [Streptomyces cellulosae]|uniref:Uncharacterized protein n=1 Tax=Streptomyces cellulosae TaxID=1968 RepID=A0ABW7YCZ4_STRCE